MTKKVATEPGRGRKQCPGCNKYPGVRSSVCPGCGHTFVKKAKKASLKIKIKPTVVKVETPEVTEVVEAPAEEKAVRRRKGSRMIILTPAGACPVRLTESSIESVASWMKAVRASYPDDEYLTDEALCYWVREFFPDYAKVKGIYQKDDTGDKVRAIIKRVDGANA